MISKRILILLVFMMPAFQVCAATSISLLDVLTEVEKASPQVVAARYRMMASKENVRSVKSGYLPSLDANFIASDGAPGAFSLLGVDSNISSTERIGTGGALVLKQEIYDFGRTGHALESARAEAETEDKRQAVTQTQVDLQALRIYLDCAFTKSQIEDSRVIAQEAKYIAGETDKFVQSGQKSIVERYLVDAQQKEAETKVGELLERSKVLDKSLAIALGRDEWQSTTCSDLDHHQEQDISALEKGKSINPFLEVEKSQLKVLQFRLEQFKSAQMPQLFGVISGGYFNNDQLNEKWNYSAGLGLNIPLFEGFKVDADIGKASAELQAQEAQFKAAEQSVKQANSKYDEEIQGLKVRLNFLKNEDRLAHAAFDLAKKRYFGLQGNLVDVREALRNLDRILTAIDEAQRDLLIARGARAIFNGVRTQE